MDKTIDWLCDTRAGNVVLYLVVAPLGLLLWFGSSIVCGRDTIDWLADNDYKRRAK